jgi:hypothetical protein
MMPIGPSAPPRVFDWLKPGMRPSQTEAPEISPHDFCSTFEPQDPCWELRRRHVGSFLYWS